MLRSFTCLILLVLTAACSGGAPVPASEPETPTPQATRAHSLTSEDVFEVQAWVDKPAPERDERVTIYGSLIKNGVYLGGMAMDAVWPEEGQERGMPNCRVQVIYQAGVCVTDAANYPPGEFVPVTVIFDYKGNRYTGETGFTPR